MAAGSDELKLWNVATAKEAANYPLAPGASVNSLLFAPDRSLFSADSGGRVIQWSSAIKTKERCKLPGPVLGLSLAPDGRHLATANYNGTVYVLRLAPLPKK